MSSLTGAPPFHESVHAHGVEHGTQHAVTLTVATFDAGDIRRAAGEQHGLAELEASGAADDHDRQVAGGVALAVREFVGVQHHGVVEQRFAVLFDVPSSKWRGTVCRMASARALVCVLALLSAACTSEEGSAPSILPRPCRARPCLTLDQEPSADDYVVNLNAATALLTWDADGLTSQAELQGGVVVLHATEPECLASSGHPCSVTLKRLRLELGALTIPTTDGDIELEQIVTSLVAPLELVDAGPGYVANAGSELQSCMFVDGTADSATVPLASSIELNLDFANEALALTGSLPVPFHVGAWECSTLDLTATVVSAGLAPWSKPEP
jgi:hypothetical protein